MTHPDDESLRQAFRTMARHDARRTPEFHALIARSAPRPLWQKVVPLASALALAACVLIGLRASSEQSPAVFTAAPRAAAAPAATALAEEATPLLAAADPAPLDFLLALPGSDALRRVPSFPTRGEFPLPGRSR